MKDLTVIIIERSEFSTGLGSHEVMMIYEIHFPRYVLQHKGEGATPLHWALMKSKVQFSKALLLKIECFFPGELYA